MTTPPPDAPGADAAGSPLLRDRLREHARHLSRTERLIADYLARIPVSELPFTNADQIATATGTSDASVIRTARSLGFTGLPDLKRLATRPYAVAVAVPAADRLTRQLNALGTDITTSVERFFAAAREIVDESAGTLCPAEVAKAVAVLAEADTVWAVGVGTAGPAALHLADTLRRAGVRTRWTRATGYELADELTDLRPQDAVVLFHAASPLPDAARLITYAHAHGIPLVLVSGTQLADAHRERVTATLTSAGTTSRLASWTLGAYVTAELLALTVAATNPTAATATHTHLSTLRNSLTDPADHPSAT